MIGVVELQIISWVINKGDFSIIEDNLLTVDYFKGYEEEYNFITDHYKTYGNVPDKESFLFNFRDFELVDVQESPKYLIDTIREQYLFNKAVPVVQNIAKMMQTDANAAAEYMMQAVKELTPNYKLGGVDIISQAEQRLESYKERINNPNEFYFTSGFPELDEIIHGFQRGEEFVVIFARTNQGKTWILEKIIAHIWRQGANVGYISPEMGPNSIGYRFDTLFKGFSNRALAWGQETDLDLEEYEKYIKELKENKHLFMVSTPLDFDNRITISKLRNFVRQNKLEALAIDGITYLADERGKRNDNKTTSLTNISEDLVSLSVELGIPIFVVVQANRTGVIDSDKDGTPELDSIRDSDGISHNATKIISLRLKDEYLEMGVKKQRNGEVGAKLKYLWNINTGKFTYTQSEEIEPADEKVIRRERKKKSGKDIF